MSIKLKLNKAEVARDKLQQEINDFINEKIVAFQKEHNIAIESVYLSDRSIGNSKDQESMPSFKYIESVQIGLETEEFLMNNID